jgi:Cd2+/Zn2+-exporting ATPase
MTATPCPGCDGERTQVFDVLGLDCVDEVTLIERGLGALDGVCSVRADPVSGRATVIHTLDGGVIERAFEELGLPAREARAEQPGRKLAHATTLALGLTLAGYAANVMGLSWAPLLYIPAILIGGAPIALRGWRRARQRVLDMNALMTIAVVGAAGIGEWAEAATTVVLFGIAHVLETRSMERARRAIGDLIRETPDQARVRRDGREQLVPPDRVVPGETIVVKPGERFPLDGVVRVGMTEVDEAPITGEAMPIEKTLGDEVFAGSLNGRGLVEVEVSCRASETTLARIIRRVEEAQASRAPIQTFVERFARVYTPAVLVLAALIAFIPPLFLGEVFETWLYRALVLLVVSCPCALVISTPVAIVSALTAASRKGVLIKGGAHLEAIARVRAIAFDKTGTLTRGRPEVTDLVPAPGQDAKRLLRLAASIEARANHPLGHAVIERARAQGLCLDDVVDAHALAGRGLSGRIGEHVVLVGSHRLFDERGLCDHSIDAELTRLESEGKTVVLVGRATPGPDALIGAIAIADTPRPEARGTIAAIVEAGIHVTMLTGDNARTAAAVAAQLGIEDVRAEQLPDEKAAAIGDLQREHHYVAMVGDGVNDAPALAAASVGIAIGDRRSDAALETADIVLVSTDLTRIADLFAWGRSARRVVAQNIFFALTIKFVVLAAALAGHASLWAAVAADMGSSLLVIGNGLRLLRGPRAGTVREIS